MDEMEIYLVIKQVLHILSPIIVGVGIVFIWNGICAKVEDVVDKDIGGIKTRIFPKIESNIFTVHKLLLKKKNIVGIVCLIFGICIFFVTK